MGEHVYITTGLSLLHYSCKNPFSIQILAGRLERDWITHVQDLLDNMRDFVHEGTRTLGNHEYPTVSGRRVSPCIQELRKIK
ncbi:hypothetical protein CPT_Slocum_032 [Serratia phage Slocum]|nr:hypothetical protein CPT_Slocum_032 [Serratia phage Slocum]